jgi:hypothetical protein
MTGRKRSLIQLTWTVSALWLAVFSTGQASAGSELSSELRHEIIDAGMVPWTGRTVSLDETLRGSNRERVSLRQFVGKPLLTYNYAQW